MQIELETESQGLVDRLYDRLAVHFGEIDTGEVHRLIQALNPAALAIEHGNLGRAHDVGALITLNCFEKLEDLAIGQISARRRLRPRHYRQLFTMWAAFAASLGEAIVSAGNGRGQRGRDRPAVVNATFLASAAEFDRFAARCRCRNAEVFQQVQVAHRDEPQFYGNFNILQVPQRRQQIRHLFLNIGGGAYDEAHANWIIIHSAAPARYRPALRRNRAGNQFDQCFMGGGSRRNMRAAGHAHAAAGRANWVFLFDSARAIRYRNDQIGDGVCLLNHLRAWFLSRRRTNSRFIGGDQHYGNSREQSAQDRKETLHGEHPPDRKWGQTG